NEIAHLTIMVEGERCGLQCLGQTQQPVHAEFLALGSHGRIAATFKPRTNCYNRHTAIDEREWMENIAVRGVMEHFAEPAAIAQQVEASPFGNLQQKLA